VIREFAPAKVNLCLHVTGRRADGYHAVESLVAFADVGDWVELVPGGGGLEVTGPFAGDTGPPGDNLAVRALRLFGRAGDFTIRVVKNIPVAAGLGGGSADAAAVARAMVGQGASLPPGLESLGADVPACFAARPAWMRGAGAVLAPLAAFPPVPVVLAHPGVPCPTGPVFSERAGPFDPPLAAPPRGFADLGALLAFLAGTRNALTGAAAARVPAVSDALSEMTAAGAALARMSGSGSCCFGIFPTPDAAQSATERIVKKYPAWWVRRATLRPAA
jgi:4-diphosphocytidyl-2-C-methyl-D-erythritol kinase